MENFDKKSIQDIRKELEKALEPIAKKYGIALALRSIRFDAKQFSAKMEGIASGSGSTGTDAVLMGYKEDFSRHCRFHGIKPVALGVEMIINMKILKLAGYNRKARKSPFILQDEEGKLYSVPESTLLKYLPKDCIINDSREIEFNK